MKYFLCSLEVPAGDGESGTDIKLGILAAHAERIIPVTKVQTAGYETINEEVSISMPVLLQQKNNATPHGVVLKTACSPKTVLLIPRIEMDLEIPEEKIHQLPKVFIGMSRYFRGIYFNKQNLVLLLDTENLMGSSTGAITEVSSPPEEASGD